MSTSLSFLSRSFLTTSAFACHLGLSLACSGDDGGDSDGSNQSSEGTDSGNTGTKSWDVEIKDYSDRLMAHAERPKLVRWNDNRFFIIWEKWTLDTYIETVAAVVDEWGNVILEPKSQDNARLPRGDDAFLTSNHAAWLVGVDGNIVLHLIDEELNHTSQIL